MKKNSYELWIFAAAYALFFTYIIPWTTILGHDFVDVGSYLLRIEYLKGGGTEFPHTGIAWLLSEPVWRLILLGIIDFFEDYRLALYLISFLGMLFTSYFLFKRVNYYIGMIFMFNPMVVDLFMGQLRSAFAFSILLLAYDSTSKKRTIILSIIAIFIHSSMPLFIAFYFLFYKLNQHIESKKFYLISILTAIIFVLFMKFGVVTILSFIGDRHADSEQFTRGSTLSYSLPWFILSLVIATFAEFKNEKERILVAYTIMMMAYFFFASAFNMYAQRFVALSMPLIIISISYLPKHFKQATYTFFFLYIFVMFKYWVVVAGAIPN